ncbi:MAG: hypothetical protein K2W85_12465 [Phycisphaerales bacterium]|nr:hypothetical protein [Phycisphaerales bacterium]
MRLDRCERCRRFSAAFDAEVEVESWRFVPVVRVEAGLPDTVHSVLALRNDPDPTSLAIQAVWYVRDESDGCEWSAKTWEAATVQDAVYAVKMNLDIDESFDKYWGVQLVGEGIPAGGSRPEVGYANGFYVTDPLGVWVNTLPDRDQTVQMLDALGYPVADNPVERTFESGEGKASAFLNTMTAIVNFAAAQPTPPSPSHPIPEIPTPVPSNWPGFPPGTVIPAAPSWWCPAWFYDGCFKVRFGWGEWVAGDWEFKNFYELTQRCIWVRRVCRSQQVVEMCVATNGTISVRRSGYEQECWTEESYTQKPANADCPATFPDSDRPYWPTRPRDSEPLRVLPIVWP